MKKLLSVMLAVYFVIHNYSTPRPEGIIDDMFYEMRKRVEVVEFATKPELIDWLAANPPQYPGAIQVIEGRKLDYEVQIQTQKRAKQIEEEVETGRKVIFK